MRKSYKKSNKKEVKKRIKGGSHNLPTYKYIGSGLSKSLEVSLKNQGLLTGRGNLQFVEPGLDLDIYTGGVGSMLMRFVSSAPVFMLRIRGTGKAIFSSALPADIVEMRIKEGEEYIFPQDTFLCCTENVEIGAAIKFKGLVFGLNFVVNSAKVKPGSGEGIVWVSGYGGAQKMTLKAGESIKVEPGLLLMMPASTDLTVSKVGSLGASLLGGEGLYMSKINGPATIYLSNKSIQDLDNHIRSVVSDQISRSRNNNEGFKIEFN